MKTLKQLREEREALNERSSYQVAKNNYQLNDLPFIVVLKRQSIRRFPDGQTVAMYYSDRLKRFIAIPFLDAVVTDTSIGP